MVYAARLIAVLILLLPIFAQAEELPAISSFKNNYIALDNGQLVKPYGIVLSDNAENYINSNWVGRKISLITGENKTDRHGNITAQIKDENGNWLQGELITKKLAFVYPESDGLMANEMLDIESKTQKNNIITTAEIEQNPTSYKGNFHIIEGVVTDIKTIKDKTFLNFGDDWKTDFTAVISRDSLKNFDKNIENLKGKKISVRGWVEEYNGPMTEIYNKHQINSY